METIIGCTNKEGAQKLFSAPAISGEDFRAAVDIYACGTGQYLAKLSGDYARKLAAQKDKDVYIVWARSFMNGGRTPMRNAGESEEPKEFFDVAFCIPVEALDEERIKDFEQIAGFDGFGPRGGRPGGGHHGVRCGR